MRNRLMQMARLREALRRRLKLAAAVLGVALLGGAVAVPAAAVPIDNFAQASASSGTHLQPVVWVCGPFRCWWRPEAYWGAPYGYWPPAYGCNPYYNPYCNYR